MNYTEIITEFYNNFSEGNAQGMTQYYHKDIVFNDPIFGTLKKERAFKMWEMLLSKKSEHTTISFDNIIEKEGFITVNWTATYLFGPQQRKVVNNVLATFRFQENKIIEHSDSFDLWKWTRQALGTSGYLMGWSSFMQKKIQHKMELQLDDFIK